MDRMRGREEEKSDPLTRTIRDRWVLAFRWDGYLHTIIPNPGAFHKPLGSTLV